MRADTNGIQVAPAQWDDLRFPASGVKQNPVTTKPDFADWRGTIKTFLFDGSTDEEVHFNAQLPHGFKYGTQLEFHVHWAPMTAPTDGQTVIWYLEYTLAETSNVFPVTANGGPGTHTFASNSQYEHILTEIASIDTSDWTSVSGMLSCRLYRDASADTYNDEIAFLEADFHYQIDRPGSRQEFIK